MEPANRREFLRAEVRLPASCQVLSPQESKRVVKGSPSGLLRGKNYPNPIDEIIEQIKPGAQEEPLYRCLQLLNNKLDFLIDQIAFAQEEPGTSLNEVIEISGSGLKFVSREALHVGDFLRINLIMPATLQFKIESITEVIRVQERRHGAGRNPFDFLVAARFIEIDEGSRDAIIETVFRTQRKIIRMEKTNKGG